MIKQERQSGFTFLELLVAMSIMVILCASLFTAMRTAFKGRKTSEEALEPVRRATGAMSMLSDGIESACTPTGILAGEFLGTDDKGPSGDNDSLYFYAIPPDPSAFTPPAPIVKYEFALSPDTGSVTSSLVRRTTSNLLAPEAQTPVEEVICRNVLTMNFMYYDGTDWLDSWDSTTQGNVLPIAVQATLTIQVGKDTYTISRTIYSPCGTTPSATPGAPAPSGLSGGGRPT